NYDIVNKSLSRMNDRVPYTPLPEKAKEIMDALLKLIERQMVDEKDERMLQRFADIARGVTYS
ncbi:unnamed protein product, partial [marine sediment metagenome]